jgi:hypothetical protein
MKLLSLVMVSRKKATVTGAVASVEGDNVRELPSNNLSNSLVGQIPGLMVINRSGEPELMILRSESEGVNTLNNSEALGCN